MTSSPSSPSCRRRISPSTEVGPWPTSTPPGWPTWSGSAARRWPPTPGPTAWTPPPSRRCWRWRTIWSPRRWSWWAVPTPRWAPSPAAAPSRCSWPCRGPETHAPTSPTRGWCCPRRLTPPSTRQRTTSVSRRCWSAWTRSSGPGPRRWLPRSTTGPSSSRSARRRTRTAWWTRSPRSPQPPQPAVCAVTSMPASAVGCCRTPRGSADRCDRGPSRWTGSRASRWTCTSTPTPPRAPRSSCTARPRCAGPSSSRARAGPATPSSTPRCSRRSPVGPLRERGRW